MKTTSRRSFFKTLAAGLLALPVLARTKPPVQTVKQTIAEILDEPFDLQAHFDKQNKAYDTFLEEQRKEVARAMGVPRDRLYAPYGQDDRPQAVFLAGGPLQIGDAVRLSSDGRHVEKIYNFLPNQRVDGVVLESTDWVGAAVRVKLVN